MHIIWVLDYSACQFRVSKMLKYFLDTNILCQTYVDDTLQIKLNPFTSDLVCVILRIMAGFSPTNRRTANYPLDRITIDDTLSS